MTVNNERYEEWLALISQFPTVVTRTTTSSKMTKTITKPEETPIFAISVDKLFELYGNLCMAGFENDEALVIVCSVANNARIS
jgi:hypothetical protein